MSTYLIPNNDAEAARFLLQAQLSASEAEIANVRAVGYANWLNQQFHAAPGVSGWNWLNSRGYNEINSATAYYDAEYPGDFMIWHDLMTSPDGVRRRVALALTEILVVSLSGISISWRPYAIARYWDLLVAGAFGNYRQLLQDITLNPAMGVYLGTRGNQKENVSTGRQPDENYAREVMQLFSIGLYLLNQDGSLQLDGNSKPIETYSQDDITNLARVFTGWDFDYSQDSTVNVNGRQIRTQNYTSRSMILNPSRHSTLSSTFLGVTIPANTDGYSALAIALDTLFNHPNVGPFIGKQLIQRLVTSNPSPAYVARVAAAFNDNGLGVRGDLSAVVSAILLDDEARAPPVLNSGFAGKLREPMLRFVQWGRSFGIYSTYSSWKIGNLSDPGTRLAQSPLRSPSVFNYFRPGYAPPSAALAANQALAPEFQIVSESSVGGYLNYMQGVVRNGIYVNAPEQSRSASNPSTNGYDIKAAYTIELAIVTDAAALVARLNLLLCAGLLSAATQQRIIDALNVTPVTSGSTDSVKRDRIGAAVLLVMASPEYLIQK